MKKMMSTLLLSALLLMSAFAFTSCEAGEAGPQGVQGIQGEKGDKGDTGAQGEKGDQGDTGAQGEKGDKGDTGAQGEKGDKGDTGAQGEKGDKGDTGAQGEKGDKGDTGAQGENGKSAYELYCEKYEYTGTEDEWLTALVNGELGVLVEHTVTFNADNGEDVFTQDVKHGEKVERPADPVRMGYTFAGWYYDDDATSELWSFVGYSVTEDMTLVAKWDYATYELPIVNIDTSGAGINSKENYTDMTFSIENCDGELEDISGGIRLRGNSTMGYAKKPYRIKFDKKQSLFGLEKAKSWVLLAEYLDPSALRNYTAFTLASELEGLSFTPTPHKVNVYLNGEYVGLYTLCEQVQENEGRMNIELEEINETMVDLKDFNFFIAMDASTPSDATAVLDETYFYIAEHDRYFELKYPEKDQFVSDEQFESFMTQLKAYTKEMMDAFAGKDLTKIQQEVNVNSLVDFLIIDMIMGERDHKWKSFNMYYTNTSENDAENGKLNFGPIWDYDYSLNIPWTGSPSQYYEYNDEMFYSNCYFQAVRDIPDLYEILKERYNEYAKDILDAYIDGIDELCESMEESVQLNQDRWYKKISSDISEKNIAFLKEYLKARKAQLDEEWALPSIATTP